MWSSRLFWKLFLVYAGLNLALAGVFLLVVSSWQKAQVMQQVEQRLHDTAIVLRSHVQSRIGGERQETLQGLVKQLARQTGSRITIVDHAGVVLADSEEDPSLMENHADRPELRQAATEGIGKSQRRSPTLGIPMYYLALPIQREGENVAFVRVALRMQTIQNQVASVRNFLWVFALGVGLLAAGLTYAMVGRIIRPLSSLTQAAQAIAAGDYSRPIQIENRDEIGLLGKSFVRMQQQLSRRVAELRENSEQQATVMGSMVEGVLAVTADQTILLANEASKKLLDIATPNPVGRPLLEVIRVSAVQEAVENVLGKMPSCALEFQTSGEPRRELSLRVTRLPGNPTSGAVIVLRDVSELKRLENLRSEFVANVSHELKTPLASIKAYAETLRMGAIDDPEHNLEFLGRIEEQADRLHELILDMLHIARVESGKEAFDITAVLVSETVERCLADFQDDAQSKQISLEIEPPDQSLKARVDAEGLRTILDNLVSNAIKYTPQGGQVTIVWRADGGFVVLRVQDTGIGVDPKDQQRVFERFFRVDKARSRELGGTGLGLAIVKHLAQAFGGEVSLTSELGRGSCFEVRLPLA